MMRGNTKTSVIGSVMTDHLDSEEVKKTPEAWPDSGSTTRFHLSQILRPLLILMAVAGCYSFDDINHHKVNRQGKKPLLSFVYRLILFLMLLTFFAKIVLAFFYIPSEAFLGNLLITLWMLLCLVWYLIFWRASTERFGKQMACFKKWNDEIMPKFQELQLEYPIERVRRRVKLLVVMGVLLTIVNVTGIGVQFALPGDVSAYISPLEMNEYTITAYIAFMTVASAVWILPNLYAAAITYLLKHAFIAVKRGICNAMKTHSCSVPPDFQKLRILHEHLCHLVGELDADLGWFYATLCVWHIGLSCFTLYQIIRTAMTTFMIILFFFWLISSILLVVFGTGLASTVNDAAHAPLETIYFINVSDVNFEKLAQINLFLSKLTGTQVGFSTCGLLIITKEFILTIAGVFLTYFAVLYTL